MSAARICGPLRPPVNGSGPDPGPWTVVDVAPAVMVVTDPAIVVEVGALDDVLVEP
jgi:hypothetical protein